MCVEIIVRREKKQLSFERSWNTEHFTCFSNKLHIDVYSNILDLTLLETVL